MYLGWEWWKQRTMGPITDDRVDAWRETLSVRQAAEITAICQPLMKKFGYDETLPRPSAWIWRAKLAPREQWRRGRYRFHSRRERSFLDKLRI
jgi:hypothetical protein